MKDQVTSIEQSRRLLELGVPAEKASMVWRRMFIGKTTGFSEWALKIGPVKKYTKSEVFEILPAFTVADLLNLLPMYVITEWGSEPLKVCKIQSDEWLVSYGYTSPHRSFSRSLVDACVSRIEWLLSDGYELEL